MRIKPKHRTETVIALARAIVSARALDRLPVFADALEEAGYDYPPALAELRRPDPSAEYAGELLGGALDTFNPFSKWRYNGDASLEYGGTFVDLTDWSFGYVSFVRVTDLASACGFDGAVMVEHGTAHGIDDVRRIRQAVESCGGLRWLTEFARRPGAPTDKRDTLRHIIADCLIQYGHCDYDDMRTEILQTEPDGPMSYDGWRAVKRLHGTDLAAYVRSVHLRD